MTRAHTAKRTRGPRVSNSPGVVSSGETKTPEYRTWLNMKNRCSNKRCTQFKDYGGRGIVVCQRWRTNYWAFLEDMGRKPSPQHSIDRINNNGDYEPSNCRWATRHEQSINRRTTRLIEFNGITATISEWAASAGIEPNTMWARLKAGWSMERILDRPIHCGPIRNIGEFRKCMKIDNAAAEEIRSSDEPASVLAARFGVHKTTIHYHRRSNAK